MGHLTYKRGVPWYWGGLILGQDPVAAEWVGYQVINEKREQEADYPISRRVNQNRSISAHARHGRFDHVEDGGHGHRGIERIAAFL